MEGVYFMISELVPTPFLLSSQYPQFGARKICAKLQMLEMNKMS